MCYPMRPFATPSFVTSSTLCDKQIQQVTFVPNFMHFFADEKKNNKKTHSKESCGNKEEGRGG